MYLNQNIYEYACIYSNGKTHKHIVHTLVERRWHSNVLNVQSFRGAECDTDQYLVVANVKEILTEIKEYISLMWRDLIFGNYLNWRLGNSIRLRSQTGLQLWRN